jgi:zinc protease
MKMLLRMFVVAALVAPPTVALQAQSVEPWRTRVGKVVRDTVLPNGLTVIVAENHLVPLVTTRISFRGGAAIQAPGEDGLAHLAEHYLFRAYGDDGAFSGAVADLRGTYNGTTSEEEVNYFMTVPSKEMPAALRILSRLVREPKINDRSLTAEKKVVTDELARDLSDGSSALRFEMGTQLWGSDWSRKNVGGSEKSVSAIRMDRVRAMLATHYVPANAAVVVSGDVSADAALAEVAARFADWKPSPIAEASAALTSTLTERRVFAISGPNVRLATVSIEWPGPSATASPSDAIVGEVLAAMIESPVSVTKGRLVGDGLAHSLSASSDVLSRRGAFSITTVMTPDAATRALTMLKGEIDRMGGANFMNDSLLTAARKRLLVDAEYYLESGVTMSSMLGAMWSAAGLEYFRNYGDAVSKVTLPMVIDFHKRYLDGQPYVAGALAPAASLEQVKAAMTATFGGKPE